MLVPEVRTSRPAPRKNVDFGRRRRASDVGTSSSGLPTRTRRGYPSPAHRHLDGADGDRRSESSRVTRSATTPQIVEVVPGCDDGDGACLGHGIERQRDDICWGSISGSPIEELRTSIPSWTAASIAATISGAFPFGLKPESVPTRAL